MAYIVISKEKNRVIAEKDDGRKLSQFGTYATIGGEVTEEKLIRAKLAVLEQLCHMMRKAASDDDFFIIKNMGEGTTVAARFAIPAEITIERAPAPVVVIE